MPRAVKGVLVECDPSIKAIILKLDSEAGHSYILQDLDEGTLVIKEPKLTELKIQLDRVLEKTQMHDRDEPSDEDDV